MTDDTDAKALHRRQFLRSLGGASTMAAAVVAAPLAAAVPAQAQTAKPDKRRSRYKADSAHVQAYYRTNRY